MTTISRRDFLKISSLTAASAGLAGCGVDQAASTSPVELPSFSYGESNMNQRILIAYASTFGSTAEIANDIAKTLGEHGFCVDVKPILGNPPGELDLSGYQAVVIGSAIHFGNWLPEAVEFVKVNQYALSGLPVAIFCVYMQGMDDSARLAYMDEPRSLLEPVAEGYFTGRFDRRGAQLLMPGLLARFTPTLDLRNPKKIHAWAEDVCIALPLPVEVS